MNTTFPNAVRDALAQELERDKSVIVMGEDIAHFGGMFRCTEGLLDRFGDKRIIDTPISESGFLGMALGLALAGKRPVVELMFVDFALVGMDQIVNQIAKTTYMSGGTVNVPLVIRTQGGGYKGAAAQHSQMLEALFLHIPGLKVVAPSNAADAKGLLAASIRDNNPVVFIEHKQLYSSEGPVPSGEHFVPLGKAALVAEGADVSIFTYSYCVSQALDAVKQTGLSADVVDLRTLNPLDWEAIESSVRKTHRAMVVHEAHARCGFGADLAAQIQERLFDELDGPVTRVCGADLPVPFSKVLEDAALPNAAGIARELANLVGGRP